jgi:hypothetical protein
MKPNNVDGCWRSTKPSLFACLAQQLQQQGVCVIIPSFRPAQAFMGKAIIDTVSSLFRVEHKARSSFIENESNNARKRVEDFCKLLRWIRLYAKRYGGNPYEAAVVAHGAGVQLTLETLCGRPSKWLTSRHTE